MLGDGPTALVVGVVVLLVGYLIRYRRWESLVAGSSTYDQVPPGTVSVVGNLTLVTGGFVVVLGLLELAGVADRVPDLAWLVALLATLAVAVPRLPVDATGEGGEG
jgi:hypothetical protein